MRWNRPLRSTARTPTSSITPSAESPELHAKTGRTAHRQATVVRGKEKLVHVSPRL